MYSHISVPFRVPLCPPIEPIDFCKEIENLSRKIELQVKIIESTFLGFLKTDCHSSESWNPGENTIISIKNSWIPAYAGMTECFLKSTFQIL